MPSYVFAGLVPGRTASVYQEGRGANPRTSVASGVVASDGTLTLTLDVGNYRAEDGRNVAYAAQADDSTTQQADLPSAASLSGTYVTILSPPATFTYNADGTPATMTLGGVITTYTWNADGTLATESRDGVTRMYSYTSGNLTAVA